MSGTLTVGKLILTNTDLTPLNHDAYDRLRVSMPYTLFDDSASPIDTNPTIYDTVTTNGTILGSNNSVILSSNGGGGSRIIYQTFKYIPTQPGKSKLAIFTSALATSSGATSRIGLFDSATDKTIIHGTGSGVFFQYSNSTCSVCLRNISIDAHDIVINQSSWNIDTLQGSGPSGISITSASDWSKILVFVIDMQWFGRVRFGLYVGGTLYYVHSVDGYDPDTGSAFVGMKLPVRHELVVTEGSAIAILTYISASVISEGGYPVTSLPLAFIPSAVTSLNTNGTDTIVLSLSLDPSEPYNRSTISSISLSLNVTKLSCYKIFLVPNKELIGSSSFNRVPGSGTVVTYSSSGSTIPTSPTSTLIMVGFVSTITSVSLPPDFMGVTLDTGITGVSQVLTLTVADITGTGNVAQGHAQASCSFNLIRS